MSYSQSQIRDHRNSQTFTNYLNNKYPGNSNKYSTELELIQKILINDCIIYIPMNNSIGIKTYNLFPIRKKDIDKYYFNTALKHQYSSSNSIIPELKFNYPTKFITKFLFGSENKSFLTNIESIIHIYLDMRNDHCYTKVIPSYSEIIIDENSSQYFCYMELEGTPLSEYDFIQLFNEYILDEETFNSTFEDEINELHINNAYQQLIEFCKNKL